MPSDKLSRAVRLGKALSAQERETLAADVLAALEDPLDDQSDAGWAAEMKRRLTEIEAGTAELIDVEVVLEELRRESGIR